MNDAQTPCVIEDQECTICVTDCPEQVKTPCCKKTTTLIV